MKNALLPLCWLMVAVSLLVLVACPAASRVLQLRVAFLSSPEGQAHLQEQIALKIADRYGAAAIHEYQDGAAAHLGAENDVVFAELYVLPTLTFLLVLILGLMFSAWAASRISRWRGRSN